MKLSRNRNTGPVEISIAPLIDVVFLLIIFLMTITQSTYVETKPVELPEAKTGERPPQGPFVIHIMADGRVMVADQVQTQQSLIAILRAEKEVRADMSVVVRGDQSAPWGQVQVAMRACASENIHRVKVAVRRKQS